MVVLTSESLSLLSLKILLYLSIPPRLVLLPPVAANNTIELLVLKTNISLKPFKPAADLEDVVAVDVVLFVMEDVVGVIEGFTDGDA